MTADQTHALTLTAIIETVGITPEEHDRVERYRPLWAAFWLAMLLPGNGAFGRNPPGTTEKQALHTLRLMSSST